MKKHINEKIGDKFRTTDTGRKVRFVLIHQKMRLMSLIDNGRIYA